MILVIHRCILIIYSDDSGMPVQTAGRTFIVVNVKK